RMPVVVKYTAMKPQVALPRVRVSAIDRRSESGISSSSSSWSASGTHPACVSGSITVNASHPSHGLLTDLDRDLHALRQVEVDTRAEADETDPVALLDLGALGHVGDDAAGDGAGDLDHPDVTELGVEVPDHPLVVLALLVEGGPETTGDVLDGRHGAVQRRAVDVDVERAHEDRDTGAAVLPRHDALHHSVGGRDDPAAGDLALGVAEEPQHPRRQGGGGDGDGLCGTRAAGTQQTDGCGGHGRQKPRRGSAREAYAGEAVARCRGLAVGHG